MPKTSILSTWYFAVVLLDILPTHGIIAGLYRTECRRDVLFKLTDRDKKLTGQASNVLLELKEQSLSGCSKKCLVNKSCKSTNFKKQDPDSSAEKNCQILDILKVNGSMTDVSGWNHYEPVKQIGPRCRLTSCAAGLKCNETCHKLEGYECIDINECLSNPCKNNATCSNLANKYTCQCQPGWEGTNCQTDTNECASNPCQHGGTCTDHLNKYTCQCPMGYGGTNCQSAGYKSCRELFLAGYRSDSVYTIYDSNWSGYNVYCHMSDNGWTLIARFSNADSKGWGTNNGAYWYDIKELGSVTSPSTNSDMISKAFYEVKGNDIKLSRSDISSHSFLLYSGGCFSQKSFRETMTSFGDFRNNARWLSTNNGCRSSCSVQYWGSVVGVKGFAHYNCGSDLKSANTLNFWCHYSTGDGAVMMIGGGGSACGRADHGIAITEADYPQFGETFTRQDFGDESGQTPVTSYALNLWIR